MAQPSSGTYNYQPAFSDLIVEAYSRIQIRPTSLTSQHMQDAAQSANLLLSEWVTRDGPMLFSVQLNSINLVQGQTSYALPSNVVTILDVYCRQFQTGNPVNLTSAFSTTNGSSSVAIHQANHGLIPGNWVSVNIPVSIGGIVLQGFYQVATVVDVNDYTIIAASSATSGVSGAGVVPSFTTSLGSSTVTVTLPNHGLYPNQNFTIQVQTTVGGLPLTGVYTVVTVPTANTFTITAVSNASGAATVFENGGAAQILVQLPNVDPLDRVMFPISRTEYADQPDKLIQAFPNTFWFDRSNNQTLYLWPTADGNGPYVLQYWAMMQVQDAVIANGATMNMPYRYLAAFTAGLAAKLAEKYPPPLPNTIDSMEQRAERAWELISEADIEHVPLFISAGLSGYFR